MFETLRTGVIMANKERKKGQDDKKNVSFGWDSHQIPACAGASTPKKTPAPRSAPSERSLFLPALGCDDG